MTEIEHQFAQRLEARVQHLLQVGARHHRRVGLGGDVAGQGSAGDPEDRLARHLDVIGINEYYGWYDPNIGDLDAIGAAAPNKPVIITEWGAEAPAGQGGAGYFSIAKMTRVYRDQVAAFARNPWIAGSAAWLLYDFRSERRQNEFQRGFNRKGLIAADKRTKKPAFGVLRDFYRRWR